MNNSKSLLERFCKCFGLQLCCTLNGNYTKNFEVCIKNKECLALCIVSTHQATPNVVINQHTRVYVWSTISAIEYEAYNEYLSYMLGNRIVMWCSDNQRVTRYSGIFASTVEEMDFELTTRGY